MKLLCLTVFLGGLISCESFMGSRFDDTRDTVTNEEVFDHFVKFSDYYLFSTQKRELESVLRIYRPSVNSVNSKEDLFDFRTDDFSIKRWAYCT